MSVGRQEKFLRISAELEMFSFLVLLLVAMPLKYVWGKPLFVRWTGTFHGAFFLLFCLAVTMTAWKRSWPLRITMLAFFSAFIPLGPLLFKRILMPWVRPNAEPPAGAEQEGGSA